MVEPRLYTENEIESIKSEAFTSGAREQTVFQIGKDIAEIKTSFASMEKSFDTFNENVRERLGKLESFVEARQGIERYIIIPLIVIFVTSLATFVWAVLSGKIGITIR